MSATQLYIPTDMASIKKKIEALKSEKVAFRKRDMIYKFTESETTIRILPYRHGPDPFNLLYFHYDITPGGALCLGTFGEDCPICEFASTLARSKDAEDKKLYRVLAPKLRVYVPVLIRGKEHEGVKFIALNRTIYETLLAFYDDPDYGDLAHPVDGTDIIVSYTFPDPVKKVKFGQIESVRPKRNRSLLSEDKNIVMSLISKVPNIYEVFPKQEYSELKKILENFAKPVVGAPFVDVDKSSLGTVKSASEGYTNTKSTSGGLKPTVDEVTTIDELFESLKKR